MDSRDYEEKRDFFRMRVDGPVHIQKMASGDSCQAEGLDISASGLSLICENSVSEGEILKINIKSHNPGLDDFAAEAEVVRVNTATDQTDQYIISVRFTAIY